VRDVLDRRTDGYRLQGASYALTISAATGRPVSRVTFLSLTNGPAERDLEDLARWSNGFGRSSWQGRSSSKSRTSLSERAHHGYRC
jgi:hypothetical protein